MAGCEAFKTHGGPVSHCDQGLTPLTLVTLVNGMRDGVGCICIHAVTCHFAEFPFRRIPNSPNSQFAEFPFRRIPISPNSQFAEISAISLRGGDGRGGEGTGEGTGVLSHVPDSCDLKLAMQKLIEHPNLQHWLLGYSAPSRRSPIPHVYLS
jgi:hypothetical protein